jgi:hypothetical protein
MCVFAVALPGVAGAGILTVSPSSARPGDVVRLTDPDARFLSRSSLRVRVDTLWAPIIRMVSNSEVHIIVPKVLPETTIVAARDTRGVFSAGFIIVRDSPTRQLVFSVVPDTVMLVNVVRASDRPTRDTPSTLEPRLSFDLISANGDALHTCSVPNPVRVPGELFAGDATTGTLSARRYGILPRATVAIRVPNDYAAVKVRVFEVAAGVDLSTPLGREQRTLLREFPVDFTVKP